MQENVEWLYKISPVSWAYQNKPLENEWDVGGVAALLILAVVFFVVGAISIDAILVNPREW